MSELDLTPGGLATLACLLEVSAPKPGNVHRGADFEDVTFYDFLTSAVMLGQVIDLGKGGSVGATILQAVKRNRQVVGTNTNLGMILLLVPLAKLMASKNGAPITSQDIKTFLESCLTPQDSCDVFAAIKLANPGGIGDVEKHDVNSESSAPECLLEAMRLAADRDAIARQFVNGFRDVEAIVNSLVSGREMFTQISQTIVFAHVTAMAREPDSLISRKCGTDVAKQSQAMAAKALSYFKGNEKGDPKRAPIQSEQEQFWSSVGELDFWLRSDGHRRNPGTTADLIAAALFIGIHNGRIVAPFS